MHVGKRQGQVVVRQLRVTSGASSMLTWQVKTCESAL